MLPAGVNSDVLQAEEATAGDTEVVEEDMGAVLVVPVSRYPCVEGYALTAVFPRLPLPSN